MGKIQLLVLSLCLVISCQRVNVGDSFLTSLPGVIGGENASVQEFPFLINIWQNSPQDHFVDHLCGGSLVSKKWVLTAAHCVLEDVTEKELGTVKPEDLRLFIGSDHISGQGGRELKVKSIKVHPEFSWPQHDIALIELAEEILDITPVSLNGQKDLGALTTPPRATVAGWGLTDATGKTAGTILQKTQVPLVSRQACSEDEFPKKRGWEIGEDMLCASSNYNTKSACPGDSGGPLLIIKNNSYTQIGVVSWGNSCRRANSLDRSNVEGYSDVANALPWIQSLMH